MNDFDITKFSIKFDSIFQKKEIEETFQSFLKTDSKIKN